MEELHDPPTIEELSKAIDSLASGKAPGNDGISPEVIKAGKEISLLEHLHELLLQCWEEGSVPQDMRYANIIMLYKNKGDRSDCNNYRGISLLSIVGKTFARVMLNRLQTLAERVYPEAQCRFRAERSTIDMIFSLRQLQVKGREQRCPLYIAFIDLPKRSNWSTGQVCSHSCIELDAPQAPEDDHFLPQGNERHCPVWWLLLGPLPHQKRRQTRVRPRANTFWHPVLPAAALHLQQIWRGHLPAH